LDGNSKYLLRNWMGIFGWESLDGNSRKIHVGGGILQGLMNFFRFEDISLKFPLRDGRPFVRGGHKNSYNNRTLTMTRIKLALL